MALITDPDDLSQGEVTPVHDLQFSGASGPEVTITSVGDSAGGLLPTIADGAIFEIRGAIDSENNGLYQVNDASPAATSIDVAKLSGSNPVNSAVDNTGASLLGSTATPKSVFWDTLGLEVWLIEQGNLSVDGVTGQALYSRAKDDWKADNFLFGVTIPLDAITSEQFEFRVGWKPHDEVIDSFTEEIRTRKLIRTAGWRENSATGTVDREYAGIISLGAFEDPANDLAYYAPGSDPTVDNTIDFDFAGPLNEAILIREENLGPVATPFGFDFNNDSPDTIDRNDAGSFVDDGYVVGGRVIVRNAETAGNNGTYEITAVTASQLTVTAVGGGDAGLNGDTDDNSAILSRDYRNAITTFLRIRDADTNGKSFAKSSNTDIGFPVLTYQAYRFVLANATDLKITATDATIAGSSPWTDIVIRYFDQAFSIDIDTVDAERDFGIVVDVGTHSGVDGSVTAAGTVLTSAEGGIVDDGRYESGVLTIHEGANKGSYTIDSGAGAITATTVTITGGTFPATDTNMSFTIERATPVTGDAEEIFEKIQWSLRQSSDIDDTTTTQIGKVADEILQFIGDTLQGGDVAAPPNNASGGGTGVTIVGFDSNDTNRLQFVDNGGTLRTFPFVAAGTINFNDNAQNDAGPAEYSMFFEYTERFTNTGFGISAVAGFDATLDSSVTDLVSELSDGDYIRLSGFANAGNNGVWVLTGTPAGGGPWTAAVRKVDGLAPVVEAAAATVSLDKNPIGTPDKIIVNDNSGTPISGNVGGPSVAFDFDYDNNVQGGRTGGVNAAVFVELIGTDLAAYTRVSATIARAVGQTINVNAALERNYSNP